MRTHADDHRLPLRAAATPPGRHHSARRRIEAVASHIYTLPVVREQPPHPADAPGRDW